MIGIYKFTNKITGESYIGQSRDIHKRYIQHKNRYDIGLNETKPVEDTYFHRMLNHYGFNNFDFEIIEECSIADLNEKEIYYIQKYNTLYPNGYNKDKGGNLPHPYALKSYEDVDEIVALLQTTKLSNIEIGEMYGVSDQTISDINNGRTWMKDDIVYPIRNTFETKKIIRKCNLCGKLLSGKTKSGLCRNCLNKTKQRKFYIPNKEDLYNLLLQHSFAYVGRKYGVSCNAVRKWCDKYNIPRHSSYYRNVA